MSVGDRRGTGARQSGWCVKVCARWWKVVLDVSFVRGYAIRTCPSLANKHHLHHHAFDYSFSKPVHTTPPRQAQHGRPGPSAQAGGLSSSAQVHTASQGTLISASVSPELPSFHATRRYSPSRVLPMPQPHHCTDSCLDRSGAAWAGFCHEGQGARPRGRR